MGTGGRPRHPATELVQQLLAAGHSLRSIPRIVRARSGHHISRDTVRAIDRGSPRDRGRSKLKPGETEVEPHRCAGACGQMIDVLPCRTCGWSGPDAPRAPDEPAAGG